MAEVTRRRASKRLGVVVLTLCLLTMGTLAMSQLPTATILGVLKDSTGAIIPGVGYSLAHKANASFTVKEGVIHTDDFKVSGKLLGMIGHGDVRFLDDKVDFDIRIDAPGPGVVLTPMYKLFEYKGEGSISKPNWHPKRF